MALKPLALTTGDPAGVGPEITAKAWRALRETGPVFVWIGDAAPLAGTDIPLAPIKALSEATDIFSNALPVFEGAVDLASEQTSVARSIAEAVGLTLSGEAAAVVTNPIRKASLKDAGLDHPGHTEYVAELAADAPMPEGFARGPAMMMRGERLTTVLATIHTPLSNVPTLITRDRVLYAIRLADQSLKRDFGLFVPRVLVCGLNPHAGEDGLLGSEDAAEIAPAIEAAQAEGIDAFGPVPADSAFRSDALDRFDVALAMYHDQGLIPVKLLDFHGTVNITIGLPIVRTSPDHGVGLDIVGKGIARPDSLIAALRAASAMAENRARYDARG